MNLLEIYVVIEARFGFTIKSFKITPHLTRAVSSVWDVVHYDDLSVNHLTWMDFRIPKLFLLDQTYLS